MTDLTAYAPKLRKNPYDLPEIKKKFRCMAFLFLQKIFLFSLSGKEGKK